MAESWNASTITKLSFLAVISTTPLQGESSTLGDEPREPYLQLRHPRNLKSATILLQVYCGYMDGELLNSLAVCCSFEAAYQTMGWRNGECAAHCWEA